MEDIKEKLLKFIENYEKWSVMHMVDYKERHNFADKAVALAYNQCIDDIQKIVDEM